MRLDGIDTIIARRADIRQRSAVSSLTETVAARLRDSILTCKTLPGTRLLTIALCKEFGVSLAVVRESLSRLAAEGLVVADPQRSFRVAPISLDDLHDLTRVRVELETLALRDAIAAGGVAWEAGIVAAFHRLSRTPLYTDLAPRRKNEEWAHAHAAFHHALINACGSPLLLQIRAGLFERSERYRRLSGLARSEGRDVEGEHRALMDAALSRDAAGAAAVLRQHLFTTAKLVRETFGASPEQGVTMAGETT